MRAITGAVVSSEPCSLVEAHDMIKHFCSAHESTLRSSDSATYVVTLGNAIREHHNFLRRSGRSKTQQRASDLVGRGYQGLVDAERERQGGEKRSSKRKREDDPYEDEAISSYVPASPEITSELRRKKEKRSNKELVSVVKQEPDLFVEEDGGTEGGKKKGRHSDKELFSSVKQEPGLVVEEELASEKKAKKNKNRDHVKLKEDMVVVKGQIVNDGFPEQGVADGEKKRKKKKHSEEEGGSKTSDNDLNSEKNKKKKKRGRGDDDDDVQEQGEQKKKRRKES